MAGHVSRINSAILVGVGAAFDFHAGVIPWAPGWVRRIGFEWAYRLALEPRRLWRRNLDGPLFLGMVMAQRVGLTDFQWAAHALHPASDTGILRRLRSVNEGSLLTGPKTVEVENDVLK